MADGRRTTRSAAGKKRGAPEISGDDDGTPTDHTAALVSARRSGISSRTPSSEPEEVGRELVVPQNITTFIGNLTEYNSTLDTLAPEEQYRSLSDYAGQYAEFIDRFEQVAVVFQSLIESRKLQAFTDRDSDLWDNIRGRAMRARTANDEKRQASKLVKEIWGEGATLRIFPDIDGWSIVKTKQLRAPALSGKNQGVTFEKVRRYILQAQFDRLKTPGKGRSISKSIEGADLRDARSYVVSGRPITLTAADLNARGLGVNNQGLICDVSEDTGLSANGEEARSVRSRLIELGSEAGSGVDLATPELRNTTTRSGRYAETEDEDSDLDEAATRRDLRFRAGGDGFNADYEGGNNDDEAGEGVDDDAATEVAETDNDSEPAKKKARIDIGETYNHPCGYSKKVPTGFLI
jgi:hypothetical protein